MNIGVQVRALLLGPRSEASSRNPSNPPHFTSVDIGLEGRVIAARKVNDVCAEVIVRNEGWGRMRYAAILLHAMPRTTIEAGLWDALRSPNIRKGDWGEEYPPQNYVTCLPAPHRGDKAVDLASYPPNNREAARGPGRRGRHEMGVGRGTGRARESRRRDFPDGHKGEGDQGEDGERMKRERAGRRDETRRQRAARNPALVPGHT